MIWQMQAHATPSSPPLLYSIRRRLPYNICHRVVQVNEGLLYRGLDVRFCEGAGQGQW